MKSTNQVPGFFAHGISGRQRGMSMISLMLAMVIGAVLLLVVFQQFGTSKDRAQAESALSDVTLMISGAQKLYGSANQYGAVTTAIAVQSSVVPEYLRVAGTNTAMNRYNGVIEFAPATISSASDSLTITYGSVKRGDCQDLVTGLGPLARRITVGGAVVKPADAQIDVAAMSAACDAADRSDFQITVGRY